MEVNVAATKAYYRNIVDASLCDCGYCRSYRLQIKSAFPEVAVCLDSFGIDIEKPFETSPLEPDANGILTYCGCQYVVFGKCERGFVHKIENVEFRVAASHPCTGIEQAHFVLEIYPVALRYIP